MSEQLVLALDSGKRVRHGRPVLPRAEDELVYRVVIALRRAGHRVYRSGAYHRVGDRAVTTKQLLALGRRVAP
jgi:hypothetical protein